MFRPAMSSHLPTYQPIPTSENQNDDDRKGTILYKPTAFVSQKRKVFYALSFVAIMYATFSGIRLLARSKIFQGCSGSGAMNGTMHRNMSTATLPSHYTLPSGDKIPSVALGVWQAGKGEVGTAVKVCRRCLIIRRN